MSGTTISGTHLSPVTLSNAATQNPATVASGATISAPSDTALAGSSGTYWTIVNDGLINGSAGISLASGGSITDSNGGRVTGTTYGIVLGQGGSVTNNASAVVKGGESGVYVAQAAGTVINSGTIVATSGAGVNLSAGGYVNNSVATAEIFGAKFGIGIASRTGIVVNAGSIIVENDLVSSSGSAVSLQIGGSVANLLGGSIMGGNYGVMLIGVIQGSGKFSYPTETGTGTVTNAGTIGAGRIGVGLRDGYIFNATGADIFGGIGASIINSDATVINAGTIQGTAGFGVYLRSGGYVSNASGGSIVSDGTAVYLNGHNGNKLVNNGSIAGDKGAHLAGGYVSNGAAGSITGVNVGVGIVGGAGVLTNSGAITATATNGFGVHLKAGGFVTNTASGTIAGGGTGLGFDGPGVEVLLNSGSISASDTNTGIGVAMAAGGSITNFGSGSITGAGIGVFIFGGTGTVVNSGVIAGTLVGSQNSEGVDLDQAGSITNTASGSITGAGRGILVSYSTGITTVVNSGSIAGGSGEGIYLGGAGRVTNTAGGTISGQSIGVRLEHGGTVTNAGIITGSGGKAIAFYGTTAGRVVTDPGAKFNGTVVGSASAGNLLELASGSSTGTISGLGSRFVNFGSLRVDSGAQWELTGHSNTLASGSTLTNNGTLILSGATLSDAGNVINNGKIELDPSTMTVTSLTGTGTVVIDADSKLVVAGAVSSGQDIDFTGNGAELDLNAASDFRGTLTGFTIGSIIDLTSVANVASSHADMNYSTNVLTVTEDGNTYTFQFDKTESFAGDIFHLSSLHGGTVIREEHAACYCRGTRIATGAGEIAVEELAMGEEVMTASGALRPIKWIGRRSYSGRFITGRKDILPICFKAGSLGEGLPQRDLFISPHHAMYLDGVLIEAKDLVNGVSIVQAKHAERVEYFHIELDSHDVILAEGAPSETFVDDDSRMMFHNAHEYALLYPGDVARPTRYCAPRVEIGFEIEAVRHRLAALAGLSLPAPHAGTLRGQVDVVGPRAIEGWAQGIDHPDAPVCLDIYAGGRLIGQTLANRYREDLNRAGFGSGRHGFVFTPPPGAVILPDTLEIRRALDGTRLERADETHRTASSQIAAEASRASVYRRAAR